MAFVILQNRDSLCTMPGMNAFNCSKADQGSCLGGEVPAIALCSLQSGPAHLLPGLHRHGGRGQPALPRRHARTLQLLQLLREGLCLVLKHRALSGRGNVSQPGDYYFLSFQLRSTFSLKYSVIGYSISQRKTIWYGLRNLQTQSLDRLWCGSGWLMLPPNAEYFEKLF